MAADRYQASGVQGEWQPGSGEQVLRSLQGITDPAQMDEVELQLCSRHRLEGERQMRKRSLSTLQPGLYRSNALAGFDGSGTGHGANNGLAGGHFAAGLCVHRRRVEGSAVSLPNLQEPARAFMANLKGA